MRKEWLWIKNEENGLKHNMFKNEICLMRRWRMKEMQKKYKIGGDTGGADDKRETSSVPE